MFKDLRELVNELDRAGELVRIKKPVSKKFELARLQNALEGKPVLFENIKENPGWRVLGNIVSTRDLVAKALGVKKEELLFKLADAIENRKENPIIDNPPCQEVVIKDPDLDQLPIVTHYPTDGGPYIASGVTIIKDPDYGYNACFHRLMQKGKNWFTARIIEKRGTDTALKKVDGDLEAVIAIGNPVHLLIAASISPAKDVNELEIAQALGDLPLAKAVTKDLLVPAYAEVVLEGRITKKKDVEGPFVDLTGTIDHTRDQPVVEIDAITYRENPIWHSLLPASNEHKILMGMPREPTIYKAVKDAGVDVKNVLITPGGCSWLHGVVQIRKKNSEDPKKAIEAAFQGHKSMKHVFIVDEDINIYDPLDIEWAMATRFQATKDLYIFPNQPGSSLDPSGEHPPGEKARTDKAGFDLTIPEGKDPETFKKLKMEKVNLEDYLE